jgi:glucose/mannose-6-phosphate isomerase
MDLDHVEALRRLDRSDMLSLMDRTPERLTTPTDADQTCGRDLERPENVVFMGVGGSAIVGDLLADYVRDIVDVPVAILRSLRLPGYVGKRTLFVAISYSGKTQETLSVLEQAIDKKARIVTISSGGRLLSQSERHGLPYLRVPSGLLPRVALPELLAAAVYVLGSAAILKNPSELLSEVRKSIGDQIENVKAEIPTDKNDAKRMAEMLVDKLPLIIGGEEDGSVLRRFKNELNENSKMPAFYYTVPEAFHDDIEGLKALRSLANVQPIFLRNDNWLAGQKRTQERLRILLRELGFPRAIEFAGLGRDRLSQLLTAVVFGDYVSVYLAALRGLDPSEMKLIPEFRKVMRAK